jgi:holo-[acyl-carrier protein] synthase
MRPNAVRARLGALLDTFSRTLRTPQASSPSVGIDLVEVAAVAAALSSKSADRYLRLVYSGAERLDCTTPLGIEPSRLAARFAAKEAVVKAISAAPHRIPLRSIEVVRSADGRPVIHLEEPAAGLARRRGIRTFSLSLTHEQHYAAAVVVATA